MVAEHLVQEDPAPRKPLVLITATEYRRRRGISRAKEYADLASGRDVPRPIRQHGQRYYLEAEVHEYIQRLIANSRGGAGAVACDLPEPPPSEPSPPPVSPTHCRACAAPIVRAPGRGRPPHRCADCRGVTKTTAL